MVTIVITTKDRAHFLVERSLKSALLQTYSDYEVIVIDDAGKDNTEQIVLNYAHKNKNVRYIKFPINKGLSFARNYGIQQAKGEYIVCLDDDNELRPKFLERAVKVIGDYDAVAVGRVVQYKDFADYVVPNIDKYSSIDWGWLIKKSVFDEIKYDEDMRANEDTDFGMQFFKRFKAIQINEPLTIAYEEMGNPRNSLSFPTQRELDGMTYFFNKNFHEYESLKEKWHLYKLMGRKFYRGGHRIQGLKYFLKGFQTYPNLRSLVHLFFILFGWSIYDKYMTFEEKLAAKKR